MEFKIGERVKVKNYEDIPVGEKNKKWGQLAGIEGEVIDKMWSEAKNCTLYKVHLDGFANPSACEFTANALTLAVSSEVDYEYEFEILENLVIARLYEVNVYGQKVEIGKGHGHIFHNGAYGVAQASSYALKRICEDLGGGSLKSYRNN